MPVEKQMCMIFQLKSHVYIWIPWKLEQTRLALIFCLWVCLYSYRITMSTTWLVMAVNVSNQKRNWTSWLGLFLQWDYNLEGRDDVSNLSYPRIHGMINKLCFPLHEWIFMLVELHVGKNDRLQFDSLQSWLHTRITCGSFRKNT